VLVVEFVDAFVRALKVLFVLYPNHDPAGPPNIVEFPKSLLPVVYPSFCFSSTNFSNRSFAAASDCAISMVTVSSTLPFPLLFPLLALYEPEYTLSPVGDIGFIGVHPTPTRLCAKLAL